MTSDAAGIAREPGDSQREEVRKAAAAGEFLVPPVPEDAGTAIEVRDLRVEYRPFIESNVSIRKMLAMRRLRTTRPVVALDGVSLQVRRGEAFGVIGSNGAGKSTLLRVLAGALPPDEGEVVVQGSQPVLLSLGVGFHRQLSGRRNVYLGGLAAGMRKADLDAEFDEIVEFADIGEAIDRPVSTYSSGMYTRLAFAVAIRTNPDVLLLDEIMSVGDEGFRAKSIETMSGILENAGTIVIVSHQLGRLAKLCNRLAWLEKGKVRYVGPPGPVIRAYREYLGVQDPAGDD